MTGKQPWTASAWARLVRSRERFTLVIRSISGHRYFALGLQVLGLTLLVGGTLGLALASKPNVVASVLLMGAGVVLWLTAPLIPRSRGATQPWVRSAQVAFLLLALGQVINVASQQRAQLTDQAREARADSVARRREALADSLAWMRQLRADSIDERRVARRDSAAEAQRRAGLEAERRWTEGRVAALRLEVEMRRQVLADSLGAIGVLTPRAAPRESGEYQRTFKALQRFLAPRVALVDDIRGNTTFQLLQELQRIGSESDVRRVIRYVNGMTQDQDRLLPGMVGHTRGEADTVTVSFREPFTRSERERPIHEILENLKLARAKL